VEWLEDQQITEYNQINDRWVEMESDTGLLYWLLKNVAVPQRFFLQALMPQFGTLL
jgi:hypothetical protein